MISIPRPELKMGKSSRLPLLFWNFCVVWDESLRGSKHVDFFFFTFLNMCISNVLNVLLCYFLVISAKLKKCFTNFVVTQQSLFLTRSAVAFIKKHIDGKIERSWYFLFKKFSHFYPTSFFKCIFRKLRLKLL